MHKSKLKAALKQSSGTLDKMAASWPAKVLFFNWTYFMLCITCLVLCSPLPTAINTSAAYKVSPMCPV
jgi:hypothetical protein